MDISSTSVFSYTEEVFEENIMMCFKLMNHEKIQRMVKLRFYDGTELKENFCSAVSDRIISCIAGREWWVNSENVSNIFEELVELLAIWKLSHQMHEETIYKNSSVLDFANKILEKVEKDLAKGKITENDYVAKCNRLKNMLKHDECFMKACPCRLIGDFDSKKYTLHICILPCNKFGYSMV